MKNRPSHYKDNRLENLKRLFIDEFFPEHEGPIQESVNVV